ncbi:MAG: SHOCT domain-containing protein [Actinomycetota bacterium]|nr:SHOCT domain-containing protein [Actinomycetota bacterium]
MTRAARAKTIGTVQVNWGIGGPIVALFLVGGIIFWVTIPDIFLGQIWVIVALGLLVLYLVIGRAARRKQELLEQGVRGIATILSAEQTGVYINEQPQVRLHLRIDAPGMETYEVTRNEVVPLIALGRIGQGQLSVSVDPNDPENVAIDWGGPLSGPLNLNLPDGRVVTVEGPQARQEIIAALTRHGEELGGEVSVRDNPAARREVWEILARHGYDVDPHTGGPRTAAKPDHAEALAELAEMRDRKLITEAEYATKKQEILSRL